MKSLNGFLQQLESLNWAPSGYIDHQVLVLLKEVGERPGMIHEAVTSWRGASLEKRGLRCHETATHYKWFVCYNKKRQYRVWLHQYKSHQERRIGHAEVPHNHRYSLASLIVHGGFRHHFYQRMQAGVAELVEAQRSYSPGDVYQVEWHEIHRLSALQDQTITLVVESPVVRHFSEAFYREDEEPTVFYDFVELHSRLSVAIGHCHGGPTLGRSSLLSDQPAGHR